MRPSSFVQLATGMLRSLRYMHSKNLCHRDVKVGGRWVAGWWLGGWRSASGTVVQGAA
jgi:serine/threonine protein kinase